MCGLDLRPRKQEIWRCAAQVEVWPKNGNSMALGIECLWRLGGGIRLLRYPGERLGSWTHGTGTGRRVWEQGIGVFFLSEVSCSRKPPVSPKALVSAGSSSSLASRTNF